MSNRSDLFIKTVLGDDFYESLAKTELWKPGTKTTLDPEEIKTALQIVPRAILSLLYHNLSSMEIGESKEFSLMLGPETYLKANKLERDVYSGNIREGGKVLVEYQFRSIPGIGLVIMSCFELYDMDNLINSHNQSDGEKSDGSIEEEKIQKLIDQRLALHNIVEQVVDKKLSHRDAMQQLLMSKLTQAIKENDQKNKIVQADVLVTSTSENCPIQEAMGKSTIEVPKKSRPLKDFLDKKQEKKKAKEFTIHMAKGESVKCPDCRHNIYDGNLFSSCICYGDCGKIFLKKTENGVKIRFSKGWDEDSIEMLLETMRGSNGKL